MDYAIDVNLADPAFQRDPYPDYSRLRADAPVCQVRLPDGRDAWLVTRYDDVAAVLQDHQRFSNRAMLSQVSVLPALSPGAQDVMALFGSIMSSTDPPDHTRLRKLVEKGFAPRLISNLRGFVGGLAGGLLDAVEARAHQTGSRVMDLVSDYAFPLPAAVIMKLLGVPAEDRDAIRSWSEPLMRFDRSAESAEALAPEVAGFIDYVRALLLRKRQRPEDDLLSRLVDPSQADRLTDLELISLTFQLIFAGHSTTSHLIGNGMLALLTHPDQLQRLRLQPSLIMSAVEEMLRYDAPQQVRARLAIEDTAIGGVLVRRGEVVLLAFASANRDASHFESADSFDIARADNRHLAFGLGIHRCFGVSLARLEGEIAISTLLERMPNLALAAGCRELPRAPTGLHQRGLAALPVTF